MRWLAIAFLCCMGGPTLAQNPTPQVTFSCRAERVGRLLKELSTAANVPLEATPAMASEVLVISVKDVALSDLLARVAVATSGEWHPIEGGGFRLVASNTLRNSEERQALAERTAAIRKSINAHLTPPKPDPAAPKDPKEESMFGLGESGVYRILAKANIEAIAKMGNGERIVFSTQPTRMQLPFTGDISAEINAMVKAHNASVATRSGTDEAEMSQLPDFVKQMTERMTKPIGQVSKAILVVSRMSFASFAMTQTELRLYDAQGKVAFTAPGMLDTPGMDMESFSEEISAIAPGAKPTPAKPAVDTPVELSADTVAVQKVFQGGGGMQIMKGTVIPPDVKAKLFRPDVYDPLSFLATDQVMALAKKRGQPVVAALPDDAVSMMSMMLSSRKPTVEDFEKSLTKATTMRIMPDTGWLVIKPARPAEARATRLDRDALTALLATADAKGVPSLDDIAAYSLKAPSPMDGGLGQLYVLYFVPGVMSQGLTGFTNWETLRFYGSLDPSARSGLSSGGRIPFAQLTGYQAEQVRKMIFGAMPSLEVDEPGKPPVDAMTTMMRTFMGGGGDYREEPTEILPNGLPGDGYVEVKVSSEPFVSPVVAEGSTMPGTASILDADMLATIKMMKDSPGFSQVAGMMPSMDRVRIGNRTVMAFTFQVAPKVASHQKLNDNRVAKDAPITSVDALPEAFQKLIAERLEAIKKSPLGAITSFMGTAGGTTIKP